MPKLDLPYASKNHSGPLAPVGHYLCTQPDNTHVKCTIPNKTCDIFAVYLRVRFSAHTCSPTSLVTRCRVGTSVNSLTTNFTTTYLATFFSSLLFSSMVLHQFDCITTQSILLFSIYRRWENYTLLSKMITCKMKTYTKSIQPVLLLYTNFKSSPFYTSARFPRRGLSCCPLRSCRPLPAA